MIDCGDGGGRSIVQSTGCDGTCGIVEGLSGIVVTPSENCTGFVSVMTGR